MAVSRGDIYNLELRLFSALWDLSNESINSQHLWLLRPAED